MAQKATEAQEDKMSDKKNTVKRIYIYMDEKQHIDLKVKLDFHRMSMSEFVRVCADGMLSGNPIMDQFIDFMKKDYMPEFEKNYQGVQAVIMKADRGEQVNQLGWISVFKSLEARNKFWPEAGAPSEAGKAAGEKMQPMIDKMQSFGTVTPGWTDWIIQ